jgi:hypothetical protein
LRSINNRSRLLNPAADPPTPSSGYNPAILSLSAATNKGVMGAPKTSVPPVRVGSRLPQAAGGKFGGLRLIGRRQSQLAGGRVNAPTSDSLLQEFTESISLDRIARRPNKSLVKRHVVNRGQNGTQHLPSLKQMP